MRAANFGTTGKVSAIGGCRVKRHASVSPQAGTRSTSARTRMSSIGPPSRTALRRGSKRASPPARPRLRDKPAGTIRITADPDHAVGAVLYPALRKLLPDHPDINVEIVTDNQLVDIVAARYDAGVRLGGVVAKDMIAIPIGPEMRMAAVAAPADFAGRSRPGTLTGPHRLIAASICACRPMANASTPASSRRTGTSCECGSKAQLVFNTVGMILQAALDVLRHRASEPRGRCARIWIRGTSPECWMTGARRLRATICIIPAEASIRRPSRCWFRRCAAR